MRPTWRFLHLRRLVHTRHSSSNAPLYPLRVLFCGSDGFSITSLEALARLPPAIIASIDVVCRPPKRTGRGLRTLSLPPIHSAAITLSLPLHPLDSFTKWIPPRPVDLIIAVSFGLLIPARLLSLSKFGGINVHPSFLPDLHGPAPISWSFLHRDSHAGVTLQTLHPTRFDKGSIIAQSPRPGLPLASCSLPSATNTLARTGADMLVDCIRTGSFARSGTAQDDGGQKRHARKLTADDARICAEWTGADFSRREMVLGTLWDKEVYFALKGKNRKRVLYKDWIEFPTQILEMEGTRKLQVDQGPTVYIARLGQLDGLVFRGADGACVAPTQVKVEGEGWRATETLVQRRKN